MRRLFQRNAHDGAVVVGLSGNCAPVAFAAPNAAKAEFRSTSSTTTTHRHATLAIPARVQTRRCGRVHAVVNEEIDRSEDRNESRKAAATRAAR